MFRRIIIIGLALLIPLAVSAQYDKAPVPMKKGMVLTQRNFNQDEVSLSTIRVVSADTLSGHIRVGILTSGDELEDLGLSKEDLEAMSTVYYTVTPDTWSSDMVGQVGNIVNSMIASMMKKSGDKDLPEVTVDAGNSKNPVFPNVMKPGESLEFDPIKIVISIEGFNVRSNTEILRYECVGTETVTVPAGTFKTYVVEQEIKMSMKILGISKGEKTRTRTWYAPGIGNVKSITWIGKKQAGRSELISIEY